MTAAVGHDLRFCVLGPLEVSRVDGAGRPRAPVPVPGRRQRAVLACLLVHGGGPVGPDVLVDAAWGEELPAEPRAALHTVVSRLRSTLGEEAVTSGPVGYRLLLADDALDCQRVERLRVAARGAGAERATDLLGEALDLFRGPAYAEHAELDFARAEAARLDRLRLDTVEEHAAAALSAGRAEETAAELEAFLVDNPYREHAVELLMTALYRAGRHAEALERFRRHREQLADELGLEPSPALRDLEARILGHELPSPAGRQDRSARPWMDTSTAFVGRDGPTARLLDLSRSEQVLTVCGPGGVGKSRLVAQSLDALVEHLAAGGRTAVVELGPVAPGSVTVAVADALGRRGHAEADGADALADYLALGHRLLVLDCCEHVREDVGGLVRLLVRRCPQLTVVVTSRRRLGVAGERVLALGPLPVPGEPTARRDPGVGPSVELFVDRVRRLRPGFSPSEDESVALAEICRLLDGLPLAIELAASRAATLGVEPVRASLAGEGPAPAAVVDLGDVVDWSARLLSAEHRRLLRWLSVFVGDVDLADVAVLVDGTGPGGPAPDTTTVAGLAELVESNLLVGRAADGTMTYRMLTLVRAAAERLLEESGEADDARLAHARWAAALTGSAALDWSSGDLTGAAARLVRCTPDLVAAVRWALSRDRLELAARVTGPVQLCTHWVSGAELSELVVAVGQRCTGLVGEDQALGAAAGAMALATYGETDRARTLGAAAHAAASAPRTRFLSAMAVAVSALYAGEHGVSAAWLRHAQEPGLEAAYAADPPVTEALVSCFAGDLPAARRSVRVALTGSEAAGARAVHAFALYAAGEIEAGSDPARGADLFRSAVAEAEEVGAAQVRNVARLALFAVLVRQGRRRDALALVEPLLRELVQVGSWPQVWTALRVSAELLLDVDRPEDAALVLAAVDAAPGAPSLVGDDPQRYAALRAALSRRLGADVLARIERFAPGLRRTQVVDRAVTLIAELTTPAAG